MRELNDYVLVTVYVWHIMISCSAKTDTMTEPKDREQPSYLKVVENKKPLESIYCMEVLVQLNVDTGTLVISR